MRCLSLKTELSWLIGLVMLMTLIINLSILIAHAGPRVRAEDDTSLHLTRELVVTAIGSLQETDDPLPALSRFYESLGNLRHVDVKVMEAGDVSPVLSVKPMPKSQSEVPSWFVDLVHTPPRVVTIPVTIKGVNYGRIAIISNPVDELAEVWSDVSWLALVGLLVTSIILGLVLLLVRGSLKPFEGLKRGLSDLEAGKSNVRIEVRGATEFRVISAALNSLAATLDRVRTENRALVDRLIRVQDDERKEIARDLHDEAGPCLFSIRAGAVALSEFTANCNAGYSTNSTDLRQCKQSQRGSTKSVPGAPWSTRAEGVVGIWIAGGSEGSPKLLANQPPRCGARADLPSRFVDPRRVDFAHRLSRRSGVDHQYLPARECELGADSRRAWLNRSFIVQRN